MAGSVVTNRTELIAPDQISGSVYTVTYFPTLEKCNELFGCKQGNRQFLI